MIIVEGIPHESDEIKWAYWCYECKEYLKDKHGNVISQNESHTDGNWSIIKNHVRLCHE